MPNRDPNYGTVYPQKVSRKRGPGPPAIKGNRRSDESHTLEDASGRSMQEFLQRIARPANSVRAT